MSDEKTAPHHGSVGLANVREVASLLGCEIILGNSGLTRECMKHSTRFHVNKAEDFLQDREEP